MTILFFTRLFYPHGGGVETHSMEIAKQLVKKGHKVVIVTESLPGIKNEEIFKGIKIFRIKDLKNNYFKKFQIWIWLFKHINLIREADVIHAHDVFFYFFPFKIFFPKKPIYITFHGYETKFPVSKKAIFIRKISELLSFGNICVGDYISKWYGTHPTYVTYGGVNISRFKIYDSRIKGGIKLKITLIGRFEKDIGIEMYLDALKILKDKKINYEFKAYGEGSLKDKIKKYGQTLNYPKDINKVIQNSDIVFCSSYLTIIKVLANKKMVFSVYDNKLKKDYLEMVPFFKWIIIENSAKKLSERIQGYEFNKKSSDGAYEWAKDQTWDKITNIYLNLWKKR